MQYDFKLFYSVWLQQKQPTWEIPVVHLEIVEYLEDENWEAARKKVLLLWRGVGKSQLTDLWVAYKLSKDPTLRFLLLSYDKATAKKSSRNILNLIKTHPFCEGLYNDRLEVQKDSFFVEGYNDDRNPNIRSYGIKTSGTGGRSDYIVFDDVEDRNNSGTEARRIELRAAISEAENTLIPNTGRVLFVGTYHDSESIYDEQTNVFGARRMRVPIMEDVEGEYPNMLGKIRWPDRYDEKEILSLQRKPKNEFLSQYMLIPKTIDDTYLDASLLDPNKYRSNMELYEAGDRWYANLKVKDETRRIISSTAYWDPALSKARGDDSVIALVLTDDEGRHYIHRAEKVKGDVDDQCKAIATFAKRNHVSSVVIEDNGPGAFLAGKLLKELGNRGIGVEAHHATKEKASRFIDAFEGPLYGSTLYIHQSVYDGPFLIQLQEFMPNNVKNQKNDYMDAVSGAILQEPAFIKNNISDIAIRADWEGYGSSDVEWVSEDDIEFTLDDIEEVALLD